MIKRNGHLNAKKFKMIHLLFFILTLSIFLFSLIWFFKLGLFFKDKEEWYSYLAFKNYDAGNHDKVLKYAKKVLDVDNDNQEINRLMIRTYRKIGSFDEARQQLLLLNQTDNPFYYYANMGEILNAIGDFNRSLLYFNKGIANYPLEADNYIGAGMVYYKLGELDKALENLEHAKSLVEISFPDDEIKQKERLGVIHAAIGFVYKENGSVSKAEEEFKVARSIYPNSIDSVSDYLGI